MEFEIVLHTNPDKFGKQTFTSFFRRDNGEWRGQVYNTKVFDHIARIKELHGNVKVTVREMQ